MSKENTNNNIKARILPLLTSGVLPYDIAEHIARLSAPQTLVSCGQDKTVKMWNICTGECKKTLKGHTDVVTCIAPYKENMFFTGSNDCTVREWNGSTGECVRVFKGHKHYVRCICTLPERRVPLVVSGSRDKTIIAWRIHGESVTIEAVIETGGLFGINALASAEHDRILISGDEDGHIRFWDTETWKEIPTAITGHNSAVESIKVLEQGPDTLIITCGGDGDKTAKVWDMHSGKCLNIFRGHVSGVWDADFVSMSDDSSDEDDGKKSVILLTVSDGDAYVRSIHIKDKEIKIEEEKEDAIDLFKDLNIFWNTFTQISAIAFAQYCDPDAAAAWDVVKVNEKVGTPSKSKKCGSQKSERSRTDMCPLAMARGKKIFLWSFPQMKKGLELVGHTGFVYDVCFLPS